MTYSSGGLIQASDYNGFASSVNSVWNSYWGQTSVASVSVGGTVTAAQWATLVTTASNAYTHQSGSVPSMSNPSAGQTIGVIANLSTTVTYVTTYPLNAYAVGSQYATGGMASKTTATGSGGAAWAINFFNNINFATVAAMQYFFKAGGFIQWQFGKTSTGTVADTEWNAFIGANGGGGTVANVVRMTSDSSAKTIAGTVYNGTYKSGGTGTPTVLATNIGFNQLTGSNQQLYVQYDSGAAYSSNYVAIYAYISGASVVTQTVWYDAGDSNVGSTAQISGGTAGSGTTFGTAPSVLLSYYPPETTYLSNTWGTPTLSASAS
jgi:hypothetical protein